MEITVIEIMLITISIIFFYFSYRLRKLLNSHSSEIMSKEAVRVLFKNAENTSENYPLDYRVHTKGLALIKGKNNKYTLVSQIKVCDIGLY